MLERRRHPRFNLNDPKTLRLRGWTGSDVTRRLTSNSEIRSLELGDERGVSDAGEIDFLADLPQILALRIYSRNVRDLSVLQRLTWLEQLDLECPRAKLPSLGPLSNLVWAQLRVKGNQLAVLDAPNLVNTFIVAFPETSLRAASQHRTIERFGVQSLTLESLDGVAEMTSLRNLVFNNCPRLTSADGVSGHQGLRRLSFIFCKKLERLDPVGTLRGLHFFTVSDGGVLESPAPLLGCRKVRFLNFGGSTKFRDGRVSVLKVLPRLEYLGLPGRRHYDVSSAKFSEWIVRRRQERGRRPGYVIHRYE